ncbi:MAG: ROK family transcriptional regulator [Gemmatimonadetes bacterium]|nr:MAG: ROK family transcriptional regulator [Gemmatimonadota bacterium]
MVILTHQKPEEQYDDLWQDRHLPDSILRLIWREHQISRAEIARQMNLSRSTVTEIVKELLETGFVVEVGRGKSSGGRRPILLEFQDDARVILGVDIGATHVAVVLINLRGNVLAWREECFSVRTDPQGTWALVIRLCDDCLAEVANGRAKLLNIGVAVPSPVDPAHPEWLPETVIPAWEGRSQLEQLHHYFGVPVLVDNDANLGALAEKWWGLGRTATDLTYVDLTYIKIGYGIGAGYILNGEIYRGARGVAGEMGHLPLDPDGKPCVCGMNGCLVTFASTDALKQRATELLPDYPDSVLHHGLPSITAIADAALAGDALGLKLIQDAANYLGIAIASWCNLMNPAMVILGGSIVRVGDLLLEPIREKVKTATLVSSIATAEIHASTLGERAIALGAATLALKEALTEPEMSRQEPSIIGLKS